MESRNAVLFGAVLAITACTAGPGASSAESFTGPRRITQVANEAVYASPEGFGSGRGGAIERRQPRRATPDSDAGPAPSFGVEDVASGVSERRLAAADVPSFGPPALAYDGSPTSMAR